MKYWWLFRSPLKRRWFVYNKRQRRWFGRRWKGQGVLRGGPRSPNDSSNPFEYHRVEFPGPRHLWHRYKTTHGSWRIYSLIVGGRASNWGQTSWADRSNNCQVLHNQGLKQWQSCARRRPQSRGRLKPLNRPWHFLSRCFSIISSPLPLRLPWE